MIFGTDLVEIRAQVFQREIDQPVVSRRALDIAILTRDVAKGTRVEPQRFERFESNTCASLPLGCEKRIVKFGSAERSKVHFSRSGMMWGLSSEIRTQQVFRYTRPAK